MYFPEFSLTNSILKSYGLIEAAKAVVKTTPITDTWKRTLTREADGKTCFSLAKFDGSKISYETTKAFLDGKDVEAPPKDLTEIENIKEALDFIKTLPPVTEETLKEIHYILLKDLVEESRTGVYRTIDNFNSAATSFRNEKSYGISHPKADEVKALILSFFEWLKTPDSTELEPSIKAAIVYFELLKIAPFESQNRKVASLLSQLTLLVCDQEPIKLTSIESLLTESPTGFLTVLQTTQNQTSDITKWLEYYTYYLAKDLDAMRTKIISLHKETKIQNVVGMVPLNERQERIVEYLQDYGYIQNKDFNRLFSDVSEDSILRDLKDMIAKKLIVKAGSTKSSRYTLRTASSQQQVIV